MKVKSDLSAGIAIFVLTLSIFLLSHVHQPADSNYSMLLSESLLHHGSFALDDYAIPRLAPTQQIGYVSNGSVYQLELVKGRLYYFFPPGSSILSVPFVAVMNAFGISAANPDGTYNPHGEIKIEANLAALLMALFAGLIFYTSRLLLPLWWSVCIAFSSALGTQVWSTASRALWSDTWGIFLLGFVVWMLLAQETDKRHIRPALLASLLAWTYVVRPTNCLSVIAITVYIFIYQRALFGVYAAIGAAWFAVFVAYSWYQFGQSLPNYYLANRLNFESFWIALAGNLVSPSRGLLIFVPIITFIFYLLLRYAGELTSQRLAALCLSIVVAHIIVVSGFSPWWGGHCYGPRYTTGLVPWFVLLGILTIKAWRTSAAKRALCHASKMVWRTEVAVCGTLLACSILINALGATAQRTWFWNVRPVNVDEQPERVWDWNHPQFLAR